MNYKSITIFFLILVGFISALLIAFMMIYSIDPALLGFAPSKTSKEMKTKIAREKASLGTFNKYIITKEQYDNLMKQIEEKNKEIYDKSTEWNKSTYKIDSLNKIIHQQDSLLTINKKFTDTLNQFKKALETAYKDNSALKDTINNYLIKFDKFKKEIQLKDERLAQQEKYFNHKVDSLEMVNFKQFASIYKNAQPTEVAKILSQIDEKDAATILKLMPKKQAGKIIDALQPGKAALILLLGAGQ
jgi:flagellar motility protein MotE (MotC chaperone)